MDGSGTESAPARAPGSLPGHRSNPAAPSRLGVLTCIFLFLASASALTAAVNYLVHGVFAEVEGDKLAYLLRHKDEFDVVFAGSSAVENMIDPRIFDDELRIRGFEIRSFNLGAGACWPHEANYLLRKLLSRSPSRLKAALIDVIPFNPDFPELKTTRRQAWHDLRETLSVVLWILDSSDAPELKRRSIREHVAAAVMRVSSLGKIHFLRRSAAEREQARVLIGPDPEAFYNEHRGYMPFALIGGTLGKERSDFLARPADFSALVEERIRELGEADRFRLRNYNVNALDAQVLWLRGRGVEPFYVASPALFEAFRIHPGLSRSLERSGHMPNVLYFDDPLRYPGLFEFERRFDSRHLNDPASAEYTRLLAAEFADRLERNPELAAKFQRAEAIPPPG